MLLYHVEAAENIQQFTTKYDQLNIDRFLYHHLSPNHFNGMFIFRIYMYTVASSALPI